MSTVPPPDYTTEEAGSDSPSAGLMDLSAKELWLSPTPKSVTGPWAEGDHGTAWSAWLAHLAQRSPEAGLLHKPDAGGESPLLWGVSGSASPDLSAWLDRLEAIAGESRPSADAEAFVAEWTAGAPTRAPEVRLGIESVALAGAAPRLAARLGSSAWWRLVETLCGLVEEATRAEAPEPAETEAVVVEQLLAGEAPLVLARLLPELLPLQALATESRALLSNGLDRLTDGEGLLAAPLWADAETPAASLLLACWTRCRSLASDKRGPWTSDAQLQYEWLVRQTLRLSDRGGRVALQDESPTGAAELLRAALRVGGDPSDHAAARLRLKGYKADDSFEEPASANHSEWSELGVLAANWRDKAPRIVVAHPADTMRIEVYAGKQPLLLGDWPVEVSLGGKRLEPTDEWDCQCWYTDEDCDYLELALDMTGDARLERQFFLSREDGVGFVAETLFSERSDSADIEIITRLPLGAGIGLRPEKETREALLSHAGEPVAGVVPLSLPEWRDDPRGGELTAVGGRLTLTRQWRGRNAVSPLWIDFSATRFGKQRTWRQLTVAENLQTMAHDVAVGYRVQAAKHQWLVYRSLDKPGNRTLLGHNLSSETFVGKFLKNGDVEEYFEIEAEEE